MARRTESTVTGLSGGDVRTGMTPESLAQAVADHLRYTIGRLPAAATPQDYYRALALAVRDRMQDRWTRTTLACLDQDRKVACYLSAEFLLGPHLGNNLLNLDLEQPAREAMRALGQDLDVLLACEEEPGLGNGGLGRLAACYLDSLATLRIPAIGYGIRYEFGIFDQEIRDGWQVEITDKWLRYGNPWEIAKPGVAYRVNYGGRTEWYRDAGNVERVRWLPDRVVKGTAYDTPIQGYRVTNCNTLRLWSAEAVESFEFEAFNVGDYYRAVNEKLVSETITKVLYPNDEPESGKRLRLAQQYFFVSCSLQDMLQHARRDQRAGGAFRRQLRGAVERHPSVDCRRRADASPGGRSLLRMGGGVAHHRGHVRLHESHAVARSARDVAVADVPRDAAASPGNHLRDQPAFSR